MMGFMLSKGLVLAEADVIVADLFLGLCLYFVRIKVSSDLEGGNLVFCNGTRWLLLPALVALLRLLALLMGREDFGGSEPVDTLEVLLPFRMYCPLGNCCSLLLNSVVSRFEEELDMLGPGQLPRPGLDLTNFGSRGGNWSKLLFRLLLLLLLLFLSRLSKCFIEIPTCDEPCSYELLQLSKMMYWILDNCFFFYRDHRIWSTYALLRKASISGERDHIYEPPSSFPHGVHLSLKILQPGQFILRHA